MTEAEKKTAKVELPDTVVELQARLIEQRETLRRMRFKHALGQLQQTHTLGQTRRGIAQIKTALGRHVQMAKEST